MPTYNISIIGCGKMGVALLHGWFEAELLNNAQVLDPYDIDPSLSNNPQLFHVKLMESLSWDKTDIVILAVKPQIMDEICGDLKQILNTKDLGKNLGNIPVLSIAAGKITSYFQKQLGQDTPVIRSMPNTPAAIGQGMSALYATDNVTPAQKQMAEKLLNAVGQTIWIDDEAQMDAVTAVSGSGPAYVFYLIEAMAQAGEKIGLSPDQAMMLARQTVIGASALAEKSHDTPASILRQNATSKGGTTQAALEVLMNGEFQDILDKAIQVAYKRGQELAD